MIRLFQHPPLSLSPSLNTRKAFTLIEIIIALVILTLLISAAVPALINFNKEEGLRKVSRTLRLYAKTAQREAILNQKPYYIELTKKEINVIKVPDTDESIQDEDTLVLHSFSVSEDIKYEIFLWNEEDWKKPDGQLWTFQPSGISDPIRIQIYQGQAWILLRFDPLTANVAEEEYYFP